MRHTILNITLAAAVGLAGFGATPVAAKDQDVLGQLLMGALALAVIGTVINDKNDDNRATTQTTRRPTVHSPQRPRNILPRHCIRRHQTVNGRVRMLAKRCLARAEVRLNRLPDRCYQQVHNTAGKLRRGYGVRCLKRRGYTFR